MTYCLIIIWKGSLPIFRIWLFTAGVMTGHSDLITASIEQKSLASRQIDHVMEGTV